MHACSVKDCYTSRSVLLKGIADFSRPGAQTGRYHPRRNDARHGWLGRVHRAQGGPGHRPHPVVMMTIVDNRDMGYVLGASDYFTRPIDWTRLSAALTK